MEMRFGERKYQSEIVWESGITWLTRSTGGKTLGKDFDQNMVEDQNHQCGLVTKWKHKQSQKI